MRKTKQKKTPSYLYTLTRLPWLLTPVASSSLDSFNPKIELCWSQKSSRWRRE